MRKVPDTSLVPVVRIDFGEDEIWKEVWPEIISPTEDGFLADVELVEDRSAAALDAITWQRLFGWRIPANTGIRCSSSPTR